MHQLEWGKASNSGSVVKLTLDNSELLLKGLRVRRKGGGGRERRREGGGQGEEGLKGKQSFYLSRRSIPLSRASPRNAAASPSPPHPPMLRRMTSA